MLMSAYLDEDAYKDKAFILALRASCLPPDLETPDPILWSADAFAMSLVERLVVLFGGQELVLLATDDEELLVLSLEQANSDGEVSGYRVSL